MKKTLLWILILWFSFVNLIFAENFLNLWDFLTVYFQWVSKEIPGSYKYINIKYDNIGKNNALYKSLQKWVYLDLFPNIEWKLPIDEYLTQEKVVWLLKFKQDRNFNYTKWEKITADWTKNIISENLKINVSTTNKNRNKLTEKVFEDIKEKLKKNYIYPEDMGNINMEYWAIQGYIDAIDDKYTVFFPPKDAKTFDDSLNGSFEWIGAYIDMVKPWEIIISAPLKDSPAEKYGAKAGDIILKAGDNNVTEKTSIKELISWIKWPEWTYINILVKRWWQEKLLKIKRWKIVLPNIEYEILEWDNCYMSINQFNRQSRIQFRDAMTEFDAKNCNKYIFDVRNNPGWVLEDVWYMLNYFVPNKKTVVLMKYKDGERKIIASDAGVLSAGKKKKLTDQNVIVLVNWWSASASEIFAWVIKDYVPNSILLWTKTFGKWSVQNLINYTDGSIFKYTVAKRYTGWSEKNIDHEWLEPDLKLENDIKTEMDEVLEVAKIYKFQ